MFRFKWSLRARMIKIVNVKLGQSVNFPRDCIQYCATIQQSLEMDPSDPDEIFYDVDLKYLPAFCEYFGSNPNKRQCGYWCKHTLLELFAIADFACYMGCQRILNELKTQITSVISNQRVEELWVSMGIPPEFRLTFGETEKIVEKWKK